MPELQVLLSLKDKMSGALKGAQNNVKGFSNKVGGGLAKAAKIGAVALAGVGIAAAGAAAKGLSAFSKFESGMNEVFTLLPGISEQAMGKMETQVKDFSREFGVLPEETIPALYQALSAGVPPNNVFEFLETAQMAAAGGVTTLETAVDGISSVVNAYGSDVVGATQASDLLFTAVKLGKTDFTQLSANISKVTPTASALGVSFDQVTASLAVLTAGGTSTAEATTQLNSLLAELGKGGTQAASTFKEISGQSFPDFIAAGGDLNEVLQMMQGHADENDQSMIDMFGSIEAAKGAMALAKGDGEAFAGALDEMGASGGATKKAFEQMEQGLSANMKKIKANVAVLWIEIGSRLAPVAQRFTDWIISTAIPALIQFGGWLQRNVVPVIRDLGRQVQAMASVFMTQWMPVIQEAASVIRDQLEPPIRRVIDFFKNNQSAMQAAGVAIGTILVVAFAALAVSAGAAAVGMIAALAPILAIGVALAAVGAAVFLAIKHWDSLTERFPVLQSAVSSAQQAFSQFTSWLRSDAVPAFENLKAAVQFVVEWIVDNWDTIYSVIEPVLNQIINQLDLLTTIFTETIGILVDLIQGDFAGAWQGAQNIIDAFKRFFSQSLDNLVNLLKAVVPLMIAGGKAAIQGLATGAENLWLGVVKPWFASLPSKIGGAVGDLSKLLFDKGTQALRGLFEAASSYWAATVQPWFVSLPSKIKDAIGSLAVLLERKGRDVVVGLWQGIESLKGWILSQVRGFAGSIAGAFAEGLGALNPFSPSEKGIEVGRGFAQGFELGIGDNLHLVRDSARRVQQSFNTVLDSEQAIAASRFTTSEFLANRPNMFAGGTVPDWARGDFNIDPSYFGTTNAPPTATLPVRRVSGLRGEGSTIFNVNVDGYVIDDDAMAGRMIRSLRRAGANL